MRPSRQPGAAVFRSAVAGAAALAGARHDSAPLATINAIRM